MSDGSATVDHGRALGEAPASGLRTGYRLLLFALSLMVCMPVYLLLFPLGHRVRRPFAAVWFRMVGRIIGLKVIVRGRQIKARPLLLVSNHVSYLDIPLLGGVTDASFVSKAEVRDWPFFGFLARISATVFIERVPAKARTQREELATRLLSGEPLILFPEGTSTRGADVLPFKSALFGVTDALPEGNRLIVQPMTIAYARLSDGRPIRGLRHALYGWYGDMDLIPHFLAVFGQKGATVEITFHDPVEAGAFANRKALAQACRDSVARGLAASMGSGPAPSGVSRDG